MTKVNLCTVWHSGTKYFKAGLEKHYKVNAKHLDKQTISRIKGDTVYTTYRDPLRIAASWGNRHKDFKKSSLIDQWVLQWGIYKELLALNPIILDFSKGREQHGIIFPEQPVNSHSDDLGLHEAIDDGNWDYFYRKVPKELIELTN